MNRVKALDDIPLLYLRNDNEEGEEKMGYERKNTPERLDKMIQFIWDYQRRHDGDSPKMVTIGTHIGVSSPETATTFWINKLIDEGRLNKISSRPFRVTITEHPANTKAIERFKRVLVARENAEEQERQRIRERQETDRQREQHEADRQAVFAAAEAEVTAETPPAAVLQDARPTVPTPLPSRAFAPRAEVTRREPQVNDDHGDRVSRYVDARRDLQAAQREIKTAMPQMIKVAETRDLVHELLERGYVVSKR
jgi:hypothetical protein